MRYEPAYPYVDGGVAFVPLKAKDGTLRGWAKVEPGDLDNVLKVSWHLHQQGYVGAMMPKALGGQRSVLMHRWLMGLQPGDRRVVDHMNHDRLDNRRSNLRVCTDGQNKQNRRGACRGAASKYRGVTRSGRSSKPWEARGTVGGKLVHLGRFVTEEEAAEAALAFRREHMPFATN